MESLAQVIGGFKVRISPFVPPDRVYKLGNTICFHSREQVFAYLFWLNWAARMKQVDAEVAHAWAWCRDPHAAAYTHDSYLQEDR